MNREKHFHPLAALHLLRKTLLVYLLPLVQVLFDRNWDALRAALRQELVLLFFISAVCWAVYCRTLNLLSAHIVPGAATASM